MRRQRLERTGLENTNSKQAACFPEGRGPQQGRKGSPGAEEAWEDRHPGPSAETAPGRLQPLTKHGTCKMALVLFWGFCCCCLRQTTTAFLSVSSLSVVLGMEPRVLSNRANGATMKLYLQPKFGITETKARVYFKISVKKQTLLNMARI